MSNSDDIRASVLKDVLAANKSRRARRAGQFSEVMLGNTGFVDQLIEVAEALSIEGKDAQAEQIIEIIKEILNNNQKLQQVVSETLADIPD